MASDKNIPLLSRKSALGIMGKRRDKVGAVNFNLGFVNLESGNRQEKFACRTFGNSPGILSAVAQIIRQRRNKFLTFNFWNIEKIPNKKRIKGERKEGKS